MTKDGRRLNISLTVSPVRDSTGQIIGASKIARNVSDRKRRQQAAQFLLDASAALACVVDYESTLNKVAHLAVPFFADWCAVDMAQDDGTLRRLAAVHTDPAKIALAKDLSRRYPPRPDFPHGALHVLRTGKPDMIAEIPTPCCKRWPRTRSTCVRCASWACARTSRCRSPRGAASSASSRS